MADATILAATKDPALLPGEAICQLKEAPVVLECLATAMTSDMRDNVLLAIILQTPEILGVPTAATRTAAELIDGLTDSAVTRLASQDPLAPLDLATTEAALDTVTTRA